MDMDTLSSEVLLEGIPLNSQGHGLPEELEFQKQLSSQKLFMDEFEACDDVSTDWLDLLTSDPMLTDAADCDKICDTASVSMANQIISIDDDDGALITTIDPAMLMNTESTGSDKPSIPLPEKIKIEPKTVKPITSVAPMIVQTRTSKPLAQQSLLKTRTAGNQRVVITGVTSNHKSYSYTPRIKTEPHIIETTTDDVFVTTQSMPLTPPSSAGGSDSEGSSPPQSPVRHVLITKPYSHSYRTINPATAIYNQPIPTSGVLMLTEEEKRTFIAEGYPIPHKLPLSKIDERNMKKVRRKIKNKISAQESRRKKKEYMDQLEKQVDDIARENDSLRRKVDNYESNNKSLISQLHKLQTLVKQYTCNNRVTQQAGTCVMVLLLCFTIFLGNWCPISIFDSPQQSHSSLNTIDYTTTIRSSRMLLMASEDTVCTAEPWPISFAKHSLQTISNLFYPPTVHVKLSPMYTNTVHAQCNPNM